MVSPAPIPAGAQRRYTSQPGAPGWAAIATPTAPCGNEQEAGADQVHPLLDPDAFSALPPRAEGPRQPRDHQRQTSGERAEPVLHRERERHQRLGAEERTGKQATKDDRRRDPAPDPPGPGRQ
jgi:hypothetical protein